MNLRIVKNSLKVEEVEILPIWSNQVAKNFETRLWIRKGHFKAEHVNFQEEFRLTKEYQNDL